MSLLKGRNRRKKFTFQGREIPCPGKQKMTIEDIRNKFPEAATKTDQELEQYKYASEVLSDLFINYVKRKMLVDTHGKTN